MRGSTGRRRAVARALTLLLPAAPLLDIEAIREAALAQHFRALPPSLAVWLATIAHVRHAHSGYDTLLAEGYDRESARFFVVGEINDTLTRWRATRLLEPDAEDMDWP